MMVMIMIAVTVYVAGMESRNAFRILVGKVEGRRCFRIGLKEIKRNDVYWVNVGEGRDQWRTLVNAVMDIWCP